MFRVNFSQDKADGLFIDEKGQLRIDPQPETLPKGRLNSFAPKQLFKLCAGLIVVLCNAFIFLVLYYSLVLNVPLQNLDLNSAFYTIGAVLASTTFSLTLFFYVLYKLYESRLEVNQVLIEIDRFGE